MIARSSTHEYHGEEETRLPGMKSSQIASARLVKSCTLKPRGNAQQLFPDLVRSTEESR